MDVRVMEASRRFQKKGESTHEVHNPCQQPFTRKVLREAVRVRLKL